MNIKEQLKDLIGIIVSPKRTLLYLPSDKFYVVSLLVSTYFAYGRAVQKGFISDLFFKFKSIFTAYLIFLVLAVISFFLGSLLIKLILRMFRKELTLKKIMNIYGYTQAPRMLLTVPLSIIFPFFPQSFKADLAAGKYPILVGIVTLTGVILVGYAIFLLIYGFIISPDYTTMLREKEISKNIPGGPGA